MRQSRLLGDGWKDYGAGNFDKLGAYTMMRLAPGEERFHAELQFSCVGFAKYGAAPGGLRLREKSALKLASRRVKLRLTAPVWDHTNDRSADNLSVETRLQPRWAVYDNGKPVGGVEPRSAPPPHP